MLRVPVADHRQSFAFIRVWLCMQGTDATAMPGVVGRHACAEPLFEQHGCDGCIGGHFTLP